MNIHERRINMQRIHIQRAHTHRHRHTHTITVIQSISIHVYVFFPFSLRPYLSLFFFYHTHPPKVNFSFTTSDGVWCAVYTLLNKKNSQYSYSMWWYMYVYRKVFLWYSRHFGVTKPLFGSMMSMMTIMLMGNTLKSSQWFNVRVNEI